MSTSTEYVQVPEEDITSEKVYGDGSRAFKLLGGKHHDLTVRVYPPYERIVFGTVKPATVYKIMPPRTKTGKWVFVHDMDDTDPYTPAESRPTGPWGPVRDSAVVDADWARHARYKAQDDEAIQALIVAREKSQNAV